MYSKTNAKYITKTQDEDKESAIGSDVEEAGEEEAESVERFVVCKGLIYLNSFAIHSDETIEVWRHRRKGAGSLFYFSAAALNTKDHKLRHVGSK